jgi:hypothetical protein
VRGSDLLAPCVSGISRPRAPVPCILGIGAILWRRDMGTGGQQMTNARMLLLGFAAIAVVSFAAGWLVGAILIEHVRWV